MDFSASKERNWDYNYTDKLKTHFLVGKELWLNHRAIQGAETILIDWNKKANPLTLLAPTSLPEPLTEQHKHKAAQLLSPEWWTASFEASKP